MNKKIMLFCLLILVILPLLAVNERYLISVDISRTEQRTNLRDLNLAVYITTGNSLICGYSELEKLDRAGVSYTILDHNPWSHYYYLVSDKRGGEVILGDIYGEIIYQNRDLILLKSIAELTLEQILSSPYRFTELYPLPVEYQYDTVIPAARVLERVDEQETNQQLHRNPQLDELLAEINADSLGYFIRKLQDFETRFCMADTRDAVADWIRRQFLRFGLTDVEYSQFFERQVWHKNVVATFPGTINPEQVVIIGGHHDSIVNYGNPYETAPGADDNGTGAAAALEIARAMMAIDYQPETTIRFITFAAEEIGLRGSYHYATNARNDGMQIKLMINNDMIGHTTETPDNWRIHLIEYSGYENFTDFSRQVVQKYSSLTPFTYYYDRPNSDSYPFWANGYGAVFFHESHFNPYYHTVNDLIDHINLDYVAETTKASAAIAVLINEIPDMTKGVTVQDAGSGSELIVRWKPVNMDIDHYKVYIGFSSGNYLTHFATEDSSIIIGDLVENRTYYIGVATEGLSGFSSSILEKSGTPRSIPLTPAAFTDVPKKKVISLEWAENREADLAGYNIYRSINEGVLGDLINLKLIKNTSFDDDDIESGIWYYYAVTAVDEDDNESEPSVQVRSRSISMDQGLLVISDTPGGSGDFFRPTLESINHFYSYALSSYNPDYYSLWEQQKVRLADLGAYSTIIWHKDNSAVLPYEQDIVLVLSNYLDLGGNLLLTSFFPTRLFGSSPGYPKNLEPGSFIYDYLKIESSNFYTAARFIGATPLMGDYPVLNINPDKAPPQFDYHIFQIESAEASPEGKNIYLYESEFTPDSQAGLMQDMPVGVEYIGEDFKTITLAVPLYYVMVEEAKSLLEYVITVKFAEQDTINPDDDLIPIANNILFPNYPNPFNPSTTIDFYLAAKDIVSLEVFNIKGQKVKSLIKEEMEAGKHSIIWNGRDDNNTEVSSGIYFYRLQNSKSSLTRKMLLLR